MEGLEELKIRFGIGFDVHPFARGRSLIVGGVQIPFQKGLQGHSDADVLLHAIADALLGALALGDIGQHFPDSDPAYRGISSLVLLEKTVQLVRQHGYRVNNLDTVILAEQPKLAGYLPEMREKIAGVLDCTVGQVSIKATTTERLGFVGRGEGIAALATVSLIRRENA